MAFAPEIFGRYVLLSRIAVGGMAEIFRARVLGEAGVTRVVAVKRLLPQFNADPAFVRMFITEARLSAHLAHANVVPIHDFGAIDGQFFIAMEYVQGRDASKLATRARASGGLGPGHPRWDPLAAYLVAEAAAGLDYAHRATDETGTPLGLVHRDVSPQNLLLSFEGEVKLADFGIALAETLGRATQTGTLKGKLQYMAPEQAMGGGVDRRADIYGLGAVLYELACGEVIRDAHDEMALLDLVRGGQIEPLTARRPDAPPELARSCARALAKHPDDRYQSAGALREELMRYVARALPDPARALAEAMEELFGQDRQLETQQLGSELDAARTLVRRAREVGVPVDSDPVAGGEMTSPAAVIDGRVVRTMAGLLDAPEVTSPGDPGPELADEDTQTVEAPPGLQGVRSPSGTLVRPSRRGKAEQDEELPPENALATNPTVPTDPDEVPGPGRTLVRALPPAVGAALANRRLVSIAAGVAAGLAALGLLVLVRGAARPPAGPPPPAAAVAPPAASPELPPPPPPVTDAAPERESPVTDTREPERPKPERPSRDRRRRGKQVREAGFGFLEVQAVPWAHVIVDGNFAGDTPLVGFRLPAGEHTLSLSYPKRARPIVMQLHVRAGQTVKRVVAME